MDQLQKSGTAIDTCSACQGFWLDRGELERMIARRASGQPTTAELSASLDHLANTAPEVREGALYDCPRCQQRLGKIAFQRGDQRVVADKCPACGGLWLDSGEMGLLFALVEEDRKGFAPLGIGLVVVLLLLGGVAALLVIRALGKL
jgi:Zn-finger nucleic acid-binding protein